MDSREITFRFKQFALTDRRCGMKIGTDAVLAGVLSTLCRDDGAVADIGAGCGIIALMLAQRYPLARIDAVEIDHGAASDLRENVEFSPWKDRVRCVEDDFSSLDGAYDLIVSNPPYYNNGDVAPDLSRATARHAGSLSPGSLVSFAVTHLNPGGRLAMIVPTESVSDIESRAVFGRLSLARRTDISTSPRRGITRSFLEFSNDLSVTPCVGGLVAGSEEYRRLTHDFYLKY